MPLHFKGLTVTLDVFQVISGTIYPANRLASAYPGLNQIKPQPSNNTKKLNTY